jgi:uncharacterized membrane protein
VSSEDAALAGPDQPQAATAEQPSSRLPAIDVARGIALIGMMAVHLLSSGSGAIGTVHTLAGGRSAALFAVLAGVGLALSSGGSHPDPERLRTARRAIAVRAALIAGLGLTLGGVPTPAAVILVYYGVLFLLALPVLGWSSRRLALAAAGWAVLSPVVSQLLRSAGLSEGPGPNLFWSDLADPGTVARHLLLTGYYPVLTWGTYLLAGLAVGRLALQRPEIARRLAVTGAGLAVAAWLAASVCVHLAGGVRALAATLPSHSILSGRGADLFDDTFFGTTPTTNWWWLGVMAPHSGAIADLVHTTGTALLVIGLALLLVPRTGGWLRPLAAAGSMTLTLYSLHVIALGAGPPAEHSGQTVLVLALHILVALAAATVWGSPARRGPVEDFVATVVALSVGRSVSRER